MSAAEHKDEGTKHFKAKEYAEAARSYTRAIELESDPVELAKLLGNRSTSYGLLQKHLEALSDAKRALQQAKLAAMVEIAQQISSVVDNMATSTFTGQESSLGTVEKGVFQNAAKVIATAPLKGVRVTNRKSVVTEAGIQSYVMVQLSKDDAARSAVQQIQSLDKEIMDTNKNLLNDMNEAVRSRL